MKTLTHYKIWVHCRKEATRGPAQAAAEERPQGNHQHEAAGGTGAPCSTSALPQAQRQAKQGQPWLHLEGQPQPGHLGVKFISGHPPLALLRILTLTNNTVIKKEKKKKWGREKEKKRKREKKERQKGKKGRKKKRTLCPTKTALALFSSYADKTSLANFAAKLEEGKVLLHCFCKSSLEGRFWRWIISSCKQLAQTCTVWEACKSSTEVRSTLKHIQLSKCNMLCIWTCYITPLMIISLYSLKLDAAPTVVSVSHITEEIKNLVMYFPVHFVFQHKPTLLL